MSDSHEYDFSGVPDQSVDALLAQAETCLDGTVQLAIASDARASTLASAFGAVAVALAVAALTMFSSSDASALQKLTVSCATAASVLFLSVLCFAYSARPSNFHVGGYEPKLLSQASKDRFWMLRYAAASIQRRIDSNRTALEASAKWTNAGMLLAVASLIGAAVAYYVA